MGLKSGTRRESRHILAINAGSSSIKAALFRHDGLEPVAWAHLENPLEDNSPLNFAGIGHSRLMTKKSGPLEVKLADIFEQLVVSAGMTSPKSIIAVAHRVVHGGSIFKEPTLLTPASLKKIEKLGKLAPLHNPLQARIARILQGMIKQAVHFGVFDTAYFSSLPETEKRYPLPMEYFFKGIRKYGFHGISHHALAEQALQWTKKPRRQARIVTCHLGNGCSLAAHQAGRPLATTMGFTPCDGLMMGTRSGALDPNIVLHLLHEKSCTPEKLEHALNRESGLLGVSTLSHDMRTLRAAADKGDKLARLAIDMFVARLRAGIAAMASALGGIDALVFSGGIGENDAHLRAETCANLGFMGIELNVRQNFSSSRVARRISKTKASVHVLVIPADEELAMARLVKPLLTKS